MQAAVQRLLNAEEMSQTQWCLSLLAINSLPRSDHNSWHLTLSTSILSFSDSIQWGNTSNLTFSWQEEIDFYIAGMHLSSFPWHNFSITSYRSSDQISDLTNMIFSNVTFKVQSWLPQKLQAISMTCICRHCQELQWHRMFWNKSQLSGNFSQAKNLCVEIYINNIAYK